MRLPGFARLRRLAQDYTNRFFSGPIVLAYHRVADLSSDPQLLSVTPRHFAEQVEVLRKQRYPMRLQDLLLPLRDRRALSYGVVVTFDDGYADNLINAKPVLECYDVPATVFVTTGYIGKERDFWWDELEKLLLQRDALPPMLRLNISGKVHEWNLGFPSENREICEHGWSVAECYDPGPRQTAYRALHKLLRPLMEDERRRVLSALRDHVGNGEVLLGNRAPLTPEDVVELAQGDLVEIGSHSVTHPVFSTLSATEQQMELDRSKSDLEDILGRTVRSFAYPYGAKSDYTEETTAAVKHAGYLCACSNFPGIVDAATDRFQLPRFLVRDWDGDEFSRRLHGWLSG